MESSELFDRFVSIATTRGSLGVSDVSRASVVAHLGLDSLALMEAIAEFEEAFDLRIPDEDLMRLRTVGDFVDRAWELMSMGEARRP
jgi:acyl carrier protein